VASTGDPRLARAFLRLSALHRELLRRLLDGDEGDSDEALADRHETTAEVIRVERFLARQRLAEALAHLDLSEA
jgi:hypothetical protein